MAEVRRLGGILALRETWCREGEPITWCCAGGGVRFDVQGMRADGKGRRGTAMSVAGAVIAVADFVANDGDVDGSGPPLPPAVIASGAHEGCEAVRLARAASSSKGLWVLTPQRLAFVEPVPEPEQTPTPPAPAPGAGVGVGGLLGRLRSKVEAKVEDVKAFVSFAGYVPDEPVPLRGMRSVFELAAGTYTLAGAAVRRRPRFTDRAPVFDTIVLSDGSALEFYAGPQGDIPGKLQQPGLIPLAEKAKR